MTGFRLVHPTGEEWRNGRWRWKWRGRGWSERLRNGADVEAVEGEIEGME